MIFFLDRLTFLAQWAYVFAAFFTLARFRPLRRNKILQIAAFVLEGIFFNVIVYSDDFPALAYSLCGFFLCLLIFHQGSMKEKLAACLIFYPAVVAVNYLMQDLGGRLFFQLIGVSVEEPDFTQEQLFISTIFYLLSNIIRLTFWILVYWLLKNCLKKVQENVTDRMWLVIDLVMLAPFVAVLSILYFMPNHPISVYPPCIAAIFTSFSSIYLISYICGAMQSEARARELEMRQAFYKDRINEEERVRRIYHDLKNHLIILQGKQGTEEARQSIQSLQKEIESYENYRHTGNDYLDMLLRDKMRAAREKKIDFTASLQFGDGGFIDLLDVSTIFGNALDNAMEACERLPEDMRFITMKAGRLRDMLVITVENSRRMDQLYDGKTTKKDRFLHGLGLINIRTAVEKYGGECVAKAENDIFVLKVTIPVEDKK